VVVDLAADRVDIPAAVDLVVSAEAAAAEAALPGVGEGARKRMPSNDTKLAELVQRLQTAAPTELESVILYGSAARGDFDDKVSDLNVLVTLKALAVKQLAGLVPVVRWWTQTEKQPAPLFFTADELRRSADVFAIELLDMKKHHRVLHGDRDVLADIDVPMNLHRVQVEHELRTTLLKLRQQFLQTPDDEKVLKAVLTKSHSTVLTLLRHILIAFQKSGEGPAREIYVQVAAVTGADAEAFGAGLELRETGTLKRDVRSAYDRTLLALEKVILALDQHLPKREWARTRTTSS
jgi:predicted nucleotidyltransferase